MSKWHPLLEIFIHMGNMLIKSSSGGSTTTNMVVKIKIVSGWPASPWVKWFHRNSWQKLAIYSKTKITSKWLICLSLRNVLKSICFHTETHMLLEILTTNIITFHQCYKWKQKNLRLQKTIRQDAWLHSRMKICFRKELKYCISVSNK